MQKLTAFLFSVALMTLTACGDLVPTPPEDSHTTTTAPDSTTATQPAATAPAASTPAPAASATKTIDTPFGEMTLVPAGQFTMGDDSGDMDEKPAHTVSVAAFYMDAREVTQKQYQELMQQNPSKFKGPERPVEQVDWYHAVLYCNRRSEKEGFKPCYDPKTLACDFSADGYRLPTEAEWEYACRAGSTTKFSFGDDEGALKTYAWFKANSNRASHPVGQKTANAFGLFDMHGNVSEWCNDTYDEKYYENSPAENPRGPTVSDKRVLRGGGWNGNADGCRSAIRYSENARFADACFGSDAYGFRCVRNPK